MNQDALIRQAIRECSREEILSSLDDAEASLLRGESRPITLESMRELAEDVKRRGRARLTADN